MLSIQARWILVLAVILVTAAVTGIVWLSHMTPLPSSTSLSCDDVDPFRCHSSAAAAIQWTEDWIRAARPGRSADIAAAEVWRGECLRDCPAAAELRAERTTVVKVSYPGGGRDWLVVMACDDGSYEVIQSTFARVPLLPRLYARLSACVK